MAKKKHPMTPRQAIERELRALEKREAGERTARERRTSRILAAMERIQERLADLLKRDSTLSDSRRSVELKKARRTIDATKRRIETRTRRRANAFERRKAILTARLNAL